MKKVIFSFVGIVASALVIFSLNAAGGSQSDPELGPPGFEVKRCRTDLNRVALGTLNQETEELIAHKNAERVFGSDDD